MPSHGLLTAAHSGAIVASVNPTMILSAPPRASAFSMDSMPGTCAADPSCAVESADFLSLVLCAISAAYSVAPHDEAIWRPAASAAIDDACGRSPSRSMWTRTAATSLQGSGDPRRGQELRALA